MSLYCEVIRVIASVSVPSVLDFFFFFLGFPADVGSPEWNTVGNEHVEKKDLDNEPDVENGCLDVAILGSEEDDLNEDHGANEEEVVETE